MTPSEHDKQRIDELLADRAVFGLTAEEEMELAKLSQNALEDISDFETIGSLLMVSELPDEAMPEFLSSQIRSSVVLSHPSSAQSVTPAADSKKKQVRSTESAVVSSPLKSSAGWFVAACLLVVAVFGWVRDTSDLGASMPNVVERRLALLKDATDAITVDWLHSEDPAAKAATGDVVWSKDKQAGFMRITGLAANDPTVQQYQLWIIDGQRDAAKPVDGGVFDIPAGASEVVIPIDAKLLVYDARAFAITIEAPGGVVVSDRKRLPLLASVDA